VPRLRSLAALKL